MPFDAMTYEPTHAELEAAADLYRTIEARQKRAHPNLLKVRDFLAMLPAERFDMGMWNAPHETASCGTACCIGGWAGRLFGTWGIDDTARALGLSREIATLLFYPDDWLLGSERPAQAVHCIDIYIETGEIDWPRAVREA